MTPLEHPVQRLVGEADGPVLVLHDAPTEHRVSAMFGEVRDDRVHVRWASGGIARRRRRWSVAVLVTADALSFRRVVSALPTLGRSLTIGWWLVDADEPALASPRPDWPALERMHAGMLPDGGAFTTLQAAERVSVLDVFAQVARDLGSAPPVRGGPVVATTDGDPRHAPPTDPGFLVLTTAADAVDAESQLPPDVVLTSDAGSGSLPPHEITGRSPTLVSEPGLLAGPLDEGLLNPAGFRRHPRLGEVTLISGRHGVPRLAGSGLNRRLPRGVTPAVVAALRDHLGVRVSWTGGVGARQVRAVGALAMAGVPVVGGPPHGAVEGGPGAAPGAGLAAALAGEVDLGDPLSREEHSVRVRRAALLEHSTLAWNERLAHAAGRPFRRFPPCSVVVVVDQPDLVRPGLAQAQRQRGADVEVVLVAIGARPDERAVRVAGPTVTVVEAPDSSTLAEALDLGVEAASGDVVLTMRADDWYGPDFAADLLLARHYAGASLVTVPEALVYDAVSDRTLLLAHEGEHHTTAVGLTGLLIDRSCHRDLDGFRARPGDGAGLASLARSQGHRVYRTHGLGHVARWRERPAEGPVDEAVVERRWAGFRPGPLLESPPSDITPAKESPA